MSVVLKRVSWLDTISGKNRLLVTETLTQKCPSIMYFGLFFTCLYSEVIVWYVYI